MLGCILEFSINCSSENLNMWYALETTDVNEILRNLLSDRSDAALGITLALPQAVTGGVEAPSLQSRLPDPPFTPPQSLSSARTASKETGFV